ncbi:MAG: hypothetical protein K2Y37_16455 [Pirellulales bacterium]|nr:hypothetical protein [Pirellulales bacterium]
MVLGLWASAVGAGDENEQPPISYSQSTPHNCVSKLQARLDQDELRLDYDEGQGYLRALLSALQVPVESQMLVFSKTSLQRDRISPQSPRAIYFNDEVYVGYCRSGEVLEISAVDPVLGAVFYTLEQQPAEQPRFLRQTDNCLVCHSSSRTEGVPGHLVRSLFVDAGGQPILSAGSYSVDHATPLEQRWGGWYVTGTHGSQRHLGNLIVLGKDVPRPVDNALGQNVTQLHGRFAVENYLAPHSDIVALLVLEHQTLVHNRLTKANYTARQALEYQREMNRALGEPETKRLDSTTRRLQAAADDLVEALLFVGEPKLTAPIAGTSGFAATFARAGPHDRQGRSLRDLDLRRRLFKYPCSYLIYSPAFDELPVQMRDCVWKRLWEVLNDRQNVESFAQLSKSDRQAILQILRATKPGLPADWTAAAGP